MRRTLLATVALLLLATPLAAADLELGIHHLATAMSGDGAFDGGEVDVVSTRGFGASAEGFFSPRVSSQLAATFLNPAAFVNPSSPPPDDVDLGTLGIDIYSLSARYHFRGDHRLSTFVGAGAAIVSLGNLEDRFADDIQIKLERVTTVLAEGGVRYHVTPSVVLDVTLTYMPVEAKPEFVRNDTTVPLPAKITLNPATLSVGAAWRF